jgi:uncharacterized protein
MADHAPSPRRLALKTDDGLALQAEWSAAQGEPRAAVVLTHPHPLHGGTMHATVVDALFRSLPTVGVSCLRFNFRGVGGSTGRHGYGPAERSDVRSALDAVVERSPDLPVVLAGWSFGADVALGVDDPRVAGWLAVAPPLRVLGAEDLVAGTTGRPVHLVVPAHDQFCPPDDARLRVADWQATEVEVVPMADHFLAAHVQDVVEAAHRFVDRLTG